MAESYFPFNSVSGDRKYKAENWANYFADFIGNGVYWADSTQLSIVAAGGMNVTLKAGVALIEGRRYENADDLTFTLADADGTLDRIDRFVIRCDYTNRIMSAVIKSSTPSLSPITPDTQRDADMVELAIGDVYIANGTVEISQAKITDQRLNSEVCGMVTGVITQLDTTAMFLQLQAALADITTASEEEFTAWFNEMKDQLSEDAAGNLQNQIDALESQCITSYTQSEEIATETVDEIETSTAYLVLTNEDGGANGKFKATTSGTYAAAKVNGSTCTIVQGDATTIDITEGRWYQFIWDETDDTVNFTSANGGGSGLQLSVVGGETEPSNPTNGTIWVKTSTEFDYYMVLPAQPTQRNDGTALQAGDIWIQYGDANRMQISLDASDMFLIFVVAAYQYDGSGFVYQPYDIYQDGWYNEGVGIIYPMALDDIIGVNISNCNLTQSISDEYIYYAIVGWAGGQVASGSGSYAIRFGGAIGVDGLVKLTATLRPITKSAVIAIGDTLSSNGALSTSGQYKSLSVASSSDYTDVELDISELTGDCYVQITLYISYVWDSTYGAQISKGAVYLSSIQVE